MPLHVCAVILWRETSHPAVKELQSVRAGACLGGEITTNKIGEFAQQQVPGIWYLVHERLGFGERATRATLDRVAREREWRARESDQWHIGGNGAPGHARGRRETSAVRARDRGGSS